jgi:hypothetical protein
MKKTINLNDFRTEFANYGRNKQFSYKGLEVLFDYITEFEAETESEVELDVIGLCCNWTEYTVDELKEAYPNILENSLNRNDEFELDLFIDELRENTTVLEVEKNNWNENYTEKTTTYSYIIENF